MKLRPNRQISMIVPSIKSGCGTIIFFSHTQKSVYHCIKKNSKKYNAPDIAVEKREFNILKISATKHLVSSRALQWYDEPRLYGRTYTIHFPKITNYRFSSCTACEHWTGCSLLFGFLPIWQRFTHFAYITYSKQSAMLPGIFKKLHNGTK